MQKHSKSRNLRERLSLPAYVPVDTHDDAFVETIRAGTVDLPKSGSKMHRLLYSADNCAKALKGLVFDASMRGASLDGIRRFQESINRAFRDLIKKLHPNAQGAPCVKIAIGAETASNGEQNNDVYRVLTVGTIGDLEELHESTRQQRDMSQLLMEAIEERVNELRIEAVTR